MLSLVLTIILSVGDTSLASQCTSGPISVDESANVELPDSIENPLMVSYMGKYKLAVGPDFAKQHLRERTKADVGPLNPAGILRQLIESLEPKNLPITAAAVNDHMMKLATDGREELGRVLHASHEISVLWLRGLQSGHVSVTRTEEMSSLSTVRSEAYSTQSSQTEHDSVLGVRFMDADRVVYDYCVVYPNDT